MIDPEDFDPEEFCPDCFAGMESSEHHEKCVAECSVASPWVIGFGVVYCERKPGHDGPHAEAEDGHVWGDES